MAKEDNFNAAFDLCTFEIRLLTGHDLVSRDSNGKSDPYVKFKQEDRELARSRVISKTLHPVWNERFVFKAKKAPGYPIQIKVYDHDFALHDDKMGSAEFDTMQIARNERSSFKLFLSDSDSKEDYMGYIELDCRVIDNDHDELDLTAPATESVDGMAKSKSASNSNLLASPLLSKSHKSATASASASASGTPTATKKTGSSRARQSEWSAVVSVVLVEAENLHTKDSSSLPDTFCKFKLGSEKYKSKVCGKSKNPRWHEQFCLYMFDGHSQLLEIEIFSQQFARNVSLGHSQVDLNQLELHKTHPLDLPLDDCPGKARVKLRVTVNKVRDRDDRDAILICQPSPQSGSWKFPVVDGVGFGGATEEDSGIQQDSISLRSCHHAMGASMDSDLNSTPSQETSLAALSDDSSSGKLTGNANLTGNSSCVSCTQQTAQLDKRRAVLDSYSLVNTFADVNNIGLLTVRVHRAAGLLAADMNGFSDPFCVLELENDRVQTHTIYKTLDPVWNRTFTFVIHDLHSNLELTVFDEDSNRKHDFLGKVCIPILQMVNNEKCWFGLKNRTLLKAAQGGILLEFEVVINQVRAAIRTLKPKEELFRDEAPKLRISVLRQNIERLTTVAEKFITFAKFLDSCLQWEYPARTVCAFIVYELIVYNFELYLIPLIIAILMLTGAFWRSNDGCDDAASASRACNCGTDIAMDEDEDKEDKKSLKEKLQMLQDTCLRVQLSLGKVASLLERARNLIDGRVPWLSCFGFILLAAAALLLIVIPLRTILMIYGVYKFSKKKLQPDATDNNEIIDFLSRSPDDIEAERWSVIPFKPQEPKRK